MYKDVSISQLPHQWVLDNLTDYQKKTLEIKYFVKREVKTREGKRVDVIWDLGKEMGLSSEAISKIFYKATDVDLPASSNKTNDEGM